MSTQHTQGRLKLSFGKANQWNYMVNSAEGTPVAYFGHYKPMTVKEGKANARRLVAAWNYAEMLGMSTEELELAESPIYSRRKLEAERDELLEALKRIEGATMSMYATRSDMLEHCQDIARAAIAKVEGGAA